MWCIAELTEMLWSDFQEMLFITDMSLSLCPDLFRNSVFDLHIILWPSWVSNKTPWHGLCEPGLIARFVTLILKEETTKLGTTSGMLTTGSHMVKTQIWSFSQGLYLRGKKRKQKLMPFNSISRHWVLTFLKNCKNHQVLEILNN